MATDNKTFVYDKKAITTDDLKIPDNILTFSLPFMVAITVLFGIICVSNKISRWEGVMLVLFYCYFFIELVKEVM